MEMGEKILYVLATAGVSLVTYIMGSKKRSAEFESTKLDNLEKSLKIYQTMINDMSEKIEDLTNKISELEITIEKLMDENKKLKQKVK